jgi:hypothetical protein
MSSWGARIFLRRIGPCNLGAWIEGGSRGPANVSPVQSAPVHSSLGLDRVRDGKGKEKHNIPRFHSLSLEPTS